MSLKLFLMMSELVTSLFLSTKSSTGSIKTNTDPHFIGPGSLKVWSVTNRPGDRVSITLALTGPSWPHSGTPSSTGEDGGTGRFNSTGH